MARDTNIFHNLVTDENSTTELLCNLMRFSAFRSLLLTRFLSEACASNISFDDIETQPYLADQVRPDLIISNDRVCVFIEIKVTQFREVTSTQPNGYFE